MCPRGKLFSNNLILLVEEMPVFMVLLDLINYDLKYARLTKVAEVDVLPIAIAIAIACGVVGGLVVSIKKRVRTSLLGSDFSLTFAAENFLPILINR